MAAGLGMLGLTPRAFWAMTPHELDAALRGRAGVFGAGGDAPTNNDLAELMRRFPDLERK